MAEWIKAKYNRSGHYLSNEELTSRCVVIIVTYKSLSGRKYVKATYCDHGKITGKVNGEVTAFMYLPKPYEGD